MGEEDVPSIFLSHSGEEKGFVERLHEALRAFNHKPFFDMVSLNRGEGLSDPILRAAAGCRVGVVVLSPTFMTKKWPMLELHTMRCRGVPNILPVFYKLTPDDFTRPLPKLWTDAWATFSCDTSGWSDTACHITSILGPVFKPHSSELAFIQEIVHDICKLIAPPPSFDLTNILGQEHLTKTIVSMFEEAQPLCTSASGACVIGLHGVGGFGKTTLCKLMVNHYNSPTCRCAWIEFPLDGNKDLIITAFKNFLSDLLLNERKNEVHDVDQILGIMREALKRHTVFIALDNVSEHSMKYAERFLGLDFSSGSRVLVTSRSEEVLRDLLLSRRCNEQMCVLQCPGLSDESEGLGILQDAFGPSFFEHISANRALMQRLLELCLFDGLFHPLALQALGGHFRRLWASERDLAPLEHELKRVKKRRSSSRHFASQVIQVIKSSYDTITPLRQQMFLDVALIFIPYFGGGFVDLCEWLSALYNEYNPDDVKEHVTQLAFDGLLQFARSGPSDNSKRKSVKVHDLYVELAQNEADDVTRKGYYVTGVEVAQVKIKDIQWGEVGRICIHFLWQPDGEFFSELSRRRCPKLQVLFVDVLFSVILADSIRSERLVLDLKCMPDLRVLVFRDVAPTEGRLTGWGNASRLGWLEITTLRPYRIRDESFSVAPIPKTLSHLRILRLEERKWKWEGPPEIWNSGAQLNTLELSGNRLLAGCPAAISLSNLRILLLRGSYPREGPRGHDDDLSIWLLHPAREGPREGPSALVRLDLSALIHLQELRLFDLHRLREVVGFSTLAKLSRVLISYCTSLEKLVVHDSPAACGNNMSSSCSMETLELFHCPDFREVQGISGLTNLKYLSYRCSSSRELCRNLDLTELPPGLKIEGCRCLAPQGLNNFF